MSTRQEKKYMLTARHPDNGIARRLDSYLADTNSFHSRNFFQELLKNGKVFVNGVPASKSEKITGGESIVWYEPEKKDNVIAQEIPLKILYEDEDIVVVDKPSGLVVHPACGHPSGTLLNALLHHAKGRYYPYLVHRLDKDTTGVIIAAKSDVAKQKLIRQFQNRNVRKVYIAVVKGGVQFEKAKINAPLGRSMRNRFKIEVGPTAHKESFTEIKTLKTCTDYSIIEVKPKTGRTHQIRAHLAYIKHPVLGDTIYGGGYVGALRPLLHAHMIEFIHPGKNKSVNFISPLPDDIKKYY